MPGSKVEKVRKALGVRQRSLHSTGHASGSLHASISIDKAIDDDEEEWWDLPPQLELAIQGLKSLIITTTGLLLPPLVLKSHLRRQAEDSQQGGLLGEEGDLNLERDLDQMRRANTLRTFLVHLPPSFNEEGLMTISDYSETLFRAASRADVSVQPSTSDLDDPGLVRGLHTRVVEAFIRKILPQHTSASISSLDLLNDLKENMERDDPEPELTISTLLQLGALSRQPNDHTTYQFSIPGLGQLLTFIRKGREEIMGILSSRQYKEMSVSELLKIKMKKSKLSVSWHLRDLVSLGNGVTRVRAPNGRHMIKIGSEGEAKRKKRRAGE